jgi:hypothetical protein
MTYKPPSKGVLKIFAQKKKIPFFMISENLYPTVPRYLK